MSKLREQLEVARHLGFVEVKPRSGIQCSEYTFLPAIKQSLLFALALDGNLFGAFSALRHHVEVSFFPEAVAPPKMIKGFINKYHFWNEIIVF